MKSNYEDKIKAIAIGGFDGMHIGHQHLFRALGERGAIVVIETGYANITPKKERENFSKYPINYLDLDDIRHLNGKGFISLLKNMFCNLEKIVIGYDFHFGKDRKYSFDDLRTLFDGEVEVIREVLLHDISVHSFKIRQYIKEAKIKEANEMLGHNYTIKGRLIKGQGIGDRQLVATANIKVDDFLIPQDGVYISLTRINSQEYLHPSVSFIGKRKSTDNKFSIETHLLNGEFEIKGNVEISFLGFIRENRKFNSLNELKNTIKKDIDIASKSNFKDLVKKPVHSF